MTYGFQSTFFFFFSRRKKKANQSYGTSSLGSYIPRKARAGLRRQLVAKVTQGHSLLRGSPWAGSHDYPGPLFSPTDNMAMRETAKMFKLESSLQVVTIPQYGTVDKGTGSGADTPGFTSQCLCLAGVWHWVSYNLCKPGGLWL